MLVKEKHSGRNTYCTVPPVTVSGHKNSPGPIIVISRPLLIQYPKEGGEYASKVVDISIGGLPAP